jgi:hypothetical protein
MHPATRTTSPHPAPPAARRVRRALAAVGEVLLRVAVAGLTIAMASIHLVLWQDGIRSAPTVGPLFMVCTVAGYVVAAAVLVSPRRLVGVVAAAAGLLNAATLAAFGIAIHWGLFGFHSSLGAPHATLALGVESAAVVCSAALCALAVLGHRVPAVGAPGARAALR